MSVPPTPPDTPAPPAGYRVLVLAKAPVAGRAKTRLGAVVGLESAAALAAAALLDTVEAATRAVGAASCHLALDGDLDAAVEAGALRRALRGWRITAQRGEGFAARLHAAHVDAGPGVVVQVGMDTPQLTPALLDAAAAPLLAPEPACDAVLGPADDGGWWVLARRDPALALVLEGVEMSTASTGSQTRAALEDAGWRVATTASLRDVDESQDAEVVASAAPGTRFARRWAEHRGALGVELGGAGPAGSTGAQPGAEHAVVPAR